MKEDEGVEHHATTASGYNISRGTADKSLVLIQRKIVDSRRGWGYRRAELRNTKSYDCVGTLAWPC